MANPSIVYFGSAPTTIIMQNSSDITGVAYPAGTVPEIRSGIYEFPSMDCGIYKFHDEPIIVKNISYAGGGTLTVTKHLVTTDAQIGKPAIITTVDFQDDIVIGPGEYLKFVTSGATNPKVAVTGRVAMSEWTN